MRILPALMLSAALALPATAQTMTDAEREAFRAEVRAYLLENPEVLMEAIGVLESRQAETAALNDQTALSENHARIFEAEADWVGGNVEGDVTLVEFMDYRCGYCKQAFAEVDDLVAKDGNIRFVLKEFPVLGEASVLASRFAIAVLQTSGPEAYKKAHDELFALRGEVVPEVLDRIAADIGVDAAAVKARMGAPEVTAVLQENYALATALGIDGTPTFIMGDVMLRGYVPQANMVQMLEEVREGG